MSFEYLTVDRWPGLINKRLVLGLKHLIAIYVAYNTVHNRHDYLLYHWVVFLTTVYIHLRRVNAGFQTGPLLTIGQHARIFSEPAQNSP